ncbi:diguanylate cyclase [Methylomonas lenta]|uniref:Diguanylate cyclase n=1 Tax=Methylomonas lenta TaxID=980561 RepID=A0A177MWL8_9GAMM|nr:bifunctional diguanylate cyclase/phosphodiesterase [Methylomonas lenta]OAI10108.1 diguanylate cyclase [Methylomonas lenta]
MKKSDNHLDDEDKQPTLTQQPLLVKSDKQPSHSWSNAKLVHELQVHQLELEMQNQQLQIHQIELENQNNVLRRTQVELDGARERYTHLYDFAPMAYFTLDSQSHIIQANHAAAKLLDIPRARLCQQRFMALVSDHARSSFIAFLAKALSSNQRESAEFELQLKNRSIIVAIEAHTEPYQPHCLVIVSDITERKQHDRELQLAAMVYMAIGEAIMVLDPNNQIIAINPAFTALTGYTEQEALGQYSDLLNSGRHDRDFYSNLWAVLLKTGHWQGEIWDKRKNGDYFPTWMTIHTSYDAEGEVRQRVVTFSDMTEQKKNEALIWKQANFDPLTGLPNRSMFHERLQLAIKQTHRDHKSLALLFLDLDRFKDVNDTLGHEVGDQLLIEVANRLKSCVREVDTVARLGGDEFTIILGELEDLSSIDRVADALLQCLSEPYEIQNETVYISVSIGITLCPNDAEELGALVKNADQAMYAAKEAGRNHFCYFTPAMQESAENRIYLANDLRGALAAHQFLLYYQPIVDLKMREMHKAEVLIRWLHPQRGLVNPAEFINIAEETGFIIEMGNWVFNEAVKQVKLWRAKFDPQFQISVNKSPIQFRQRMGNQDWLERMLEIGMPKGSIVVEITESLLMDVSSDVSDKLLSFRDAGFQVSLDDFGTGYSSLSYLNKYHIDYLKIDQSFVRNLTSGISDLALCKAMIVMAHELGMKVIAEGIESELQRELLLAAGCDFGQGYLFSKPINADDFEKLFQPKVFNWPELTRCY